MRGLTPRVASDIVKHHLATVWLYSWFIHIVKMVGPVGFAPTADRLKGGCYIYMSFGPIGLNVSVLITLFMCMKTKLCPKCSQVKPLSDFYKRGGKRSDGSPYCKSCFIAYSVNRWVEKKKEAVAYKGGACEDCKGVFDYYLYDFHHIDPNTKEYDWHKLRLYGWERMKKELDKCALLCCMCHRRREQIH